MEMFVSDAAKPKFSLKNPLASGPMSTKKEEQRKEILPSIYIVIRLRHIKVMSSRRFNT